MKQTRIKNLVITMLMMTYVVTLEIMMTKQYIKRKSAATAIENLQKCLKR